MCPGSRSTSRRRTWEPRCGCRPAWSRFVPSSSSACRRSRSRPGERGRAARRTAGAAGGTWYPNSFRAPIESNEPWLSSALDVVAGLLDRLDAAGLPPERVVLLGFSQGACLTLEYAARNARRYGGVVGLSGGVIGPDGAPRDDHGSLAGTPVFLGCSDHDPHIPAYRVHHAAEVLGGLGAGVTAVLYPDLGHTVDREELEHVRDIMSRLVAAAGTGQERDGAER